MNSNVSVYPTIRIQKKRFHLSTYALILFFVFLPFEYPLANFGIGSILRYVGVLAMILAMFDIIRSGREKMTFDYRIILMALWIIYALLSVIWCASMSGFEQFFPIYLRNALMFLMISMVKYRKEEAEMMCKAYIFGVVLLLLYMTFVPGAVTYSAFQHRLTLAVGDSEGFDQNYLATLISMPYGFVLYDLVMQKRKMAKKILFGAFCVACIYYVVLTGSRTGLIELAIITLLCLNLGIKKNLVVIVIFIVALWFVIPLIIKALPQDLLDRYLLGAMLGQSDESGSRIELWRVAWKTISNGNWFFGYGAGSSRTIISSGTGQSSSIHNAYLAQIAEFGIIGFAMLSTMIFRMVKDLIGSGNRKQCIAFVGVIIASFFLDVLTTKFFWGAMMILSVYVSGIHRKNN